MRAAARARGEPRTGRGRACSLDREAQDWFVCSVRWLLLLPLLLPLQRLLLACGLDDKVQEFRARKEVEERG